MNYRPEETKGTGGRPARKTDRAYVARRIRLATSAMVLGAVIATAGIGTAVATEIPGTTTKAVLATATTTTAVSGSTTTTVSGSTTTTAATGSTTTTAPTPTTTLAPTTTTTSAVTTSGAS